MSTNNPAFASIGKQSDTIEVRLSYKIVELFSEGLYSSPNKAIEELVANSFDAGAQRVHVILSANMHSQDATIAIIDDGIGMNADGLRQHWLIGSSNKRNLGELPLGRQQIGKFGIGKLATYVLAERFSHISKKGNKFYATSMNYQTIDKRTGDTDLEPKTPIKLALRELTEQQAKEALDPWIKKTDLKLFGKGSLPTWTAAIMSSLKPKVHEIKPGLLEWVLRTALPLRPDFGIWLNTKKLIPSKQGKGLIKKWVLGKDLKELPRPSPKEINAVIDNDKEKDSEFRFALDVPQLGKVFGYAEAYKDLLTGKSDDIGRSHGFFVYVFGRLVNVTDGHFGISPNELRHGTFGRFRLVIHMDGLDEELRSNREAISEGPLLSIAQDILRSIFNAVRSAIEKHDLAEEPGNQLARKLASSPAALSRKPIVELARSVIDGESFSRYISVPSFGSKPERDKFIETLAERADEGTHFITGLSLDYDGRADQGLAQYDTVTGKLRLNAWHPFVATFYDDFTRKGSNQPLQLFAMAEVLAEAHLYEVGVSKIEIDEFLNRRDLLLRMLANESGRNSAHSVALSLRESRNSPDGLEDAAAAAFSSLGFEVISIGGKNNPDGVATALLPADGTNAPQQYKISLEAKSKQKDKGAVSARNVDTAAVTRNRDKYECHHSLVIGRAFPTKQGDDSAIVKQIDDDRKTTAQLGNPKTITLITIDDLAELVRLRPLKQIGLKKIRELFVKCRTPEESAEWIQEIKNTKIKKPPYKKIIETIEHLQKKYTKQPVKYSALRVSLGHQTPSIDYDTDEELIELCKGMSQMAPGTLFATNEAVGLDQSAKNVIQAIEAATKELEE